MRNTPHLLLVVLMTLVCVTTIIPAATTQPSKKADPDPMPEKSVWTGFESNDPRKARHVEFKARLKVLERDGEKFAAEYSVQGRALRLEGKVHNGVIEARATKIISGTWGVALEVPWQGKVQDQEMVLVHQNEKKLDMTTKLSLKSERDAN